MSIVNDAVQRIVHETDKLGNFFALKKVQGGPITEKEVDQLNEIRGNIVNQLQNLVCVDSRVAEAYRSLGHLFK